MKDKGITTTSTGRIRLRVTYKGPHGRRDLQETLPAGTTMAQARARRDEIYAQLKAQQNEHQISIDTVGDYALSWIERMASDLKPTTLVTYMSAIEHRILPKLHDVRITDISRAHVQGWVAWADQCKKPDGSSYSRQTRLGWWRVLKSMLLDMAAEHGLPLDPTARIKPPRAGGGKARTRRTLTGQELGKFLTAFAEAFPTRYAEAVLLAYTGMRSGELYGLQWSSVDLASGTITVEASAARGIRVESTKTGVSRTIPLTNEALEVLKSHRVEQAREHGIQTLVFPSANGKPRHSSSIRKPLQKTSRALRLEFDVTPQVLRRTLNTLAVTSGVDGAVLRSIMGHSSPGMTELYAGIEMEQKRSALDVLKP